MLGQPIAARERHLLAWSMDVTNSWIKKISILLLSRISMLDRFDMFNARKIQEFVIFISRPFPRYPGEALYPLIYYIY